MNASDRALDRYLNELCWAMGGSFAEQQAVRDELRAHAREIVRELELAGVGGAEAMRQALAELGDPVALGARMRDSRGGIALGRPLPQRDGDVLIGRRTPPARLSPMLMLAFAAGGLASVLVALAYAWPG